MTSLFSVRLPAALTRCGLSLKYLPQQCQRPLTLSAVDLAARKGTREKARKKKIKIEVKKISFMEKKLNPRKSKSGSFYDKHSTKDHLNVSTEDVYANFFFRPTVYSASEAIELFKETHHPTMLNDPEAFINVEIELDMTGEKKTRTKDNFFRTALIPHAFESSANRAILVFCSEKTLQQQCSDAGALQVGGSEIVKKIQNGEIKLADFEYFLAHSGMASEILPLRGIMKKRFPSVITGTVDDDIAKLVNKYNNGLQYKGVKDPNQAKFGLVKTNFGKIGMDTLQLVENFSTILKDVNSTRPKREGKFVTRCYFTCPPSKEKFIVNPFEFIEEFFVKTQGKGRAQAAAQQEDSDSDDDDERMAKTA